jgi:5-methylcytosine-specific restriction endonuclease McrA
MSRGGQGGSTTAWRKLRLAVLERDGWTCGYCRATLHRRRCSTTGCAYCPHVDHRVPKAQGGGDHPSNLLASCARCNLSRSADGKASTPTGRSRQW